MTITSVGNNNNLKKLITITVIIPSVVIITKD